MAKEQTQQLDEKYQSQIEVGNKTMATLTKYMEANKTLSARNTVLEKLVNTLKSKVASLTSSNSSKDILIAKDKKIEELRQENALITKK